MSSTSHFSSAGGTPTAPGRYVDVDAITPVEFVPGLEFRPVLGERTMTNFVRFAPHTEAPVHVHEEEQIVLVLDGEAVPAGGMGVCKQLKDEIYRCPPVLVLLGRPQDAWLATWSRADAVVPHPLDPVAVVEAVAELARRRVG